MVNSSYVRINVYVHKAGRMLNIKLNSEVCTGKMVGLPLELLHWVLIAVVLAGW